MNINDLPSEERPREKLANHGASSLSDAELIAIFLRVGVPGESAIQIGQRLIREYGSLSGLSRLSVKELVKEHGIGPAKAAQLSASFEIADRISRESIVAKPLHAPELVYKALVPQLRHKSTEGLFVLLTDTKIHHVRTIEIASGSVNTCACHPRDVLRPVIENQAYGFILVHNHPSGDPTASLADDKVTKTVGEAADLMQVRFVDHIIIGQSIDGRLPYYSYREHGKL